MENNFENIIKGCLEGKRSSQYALYNLLAPKLRVVCKRYMTSKEEAEDCLQEAFIKIFHNIDKYRNDGEFAAWARRITVNLMITKLQQNKRFVVERINEQSDDLNYASQADSSTDLNLSYLLNVIEKLSAERRMVFNLHAIEGYDHKEIGALLGISEVNSRNILHMARKDLFFHLHKMKSGYEQRVS